MKEKCYKYNLTFLVEQSNQAITLISFLQHARIMKINLKKLIVSIITARYMNNIVESQVEFPRRNAMIYKVISFPFRAHVYSMSHGRVLALDHGVFLGSWTSQGTQVGSFQG